MSTPALKAVPDNKPLSLLLGLYNEALADQKKAAAEVADLFQRIMDHPDVKAGIKKDSGTNPINDQLKVVTKETRSWDQKQLAALQSRVAPEFWPFKTVYSEDAKAFKVLAERFPDLAKELDQALTTKPAKATLNIKLEDE